MFKRLWGSNGEHQLHHSVVSSTIDWLRLNDAALCLGVFRISPAQRELDQLKAAAQRKPKSGMRLFQGHGVHAIAGLLKLYFRELEPPVLTYELVEAWISAVQIQNRTERSRCLRKCLASLPEPNFSTLYNLIEYLTIVASHAATNKMDNKNLAIVFGPSLLRSPVFDPMTALQQNQYGVDLVVDLIDNFGTLFDVFSAEHRDQPLIAAHVPCPAILQILEGNDRRLSATFESAINRGTLRMSIQNSLNGILHSRTDSASSSPSPLRNENSPQPSSVSPAAQMAGAPAGSASSDGRKQEPDLDGFLLRLSQSPADLSSLSGFLTALTDEQLTTFIGKVDQNLGYYQPQSELLQLPQEERRQSQILTSPLMELQLQSKKDALPALADGLFAEYAAANMTLDLEVFRLFYRELCSEIQQVCPWGVRDIDELFASIIEVPLSSLTGAESMCRATFVDWFARVLSGQTLSSVSSVSSSSSSSFFQQQQQQQQSFLHPRPLSVPSPSPKSGTASSLPGSAARSSPSVTKATMPGGKMSPIRSIFMTVHRQQKYLPLQKLQSGEYPSTFDQHHLEMYLDPLEFERVFGMGKNRFVLLPFWTRAHLKRRNNLTST